MPKRANPESPAIRCSVSTDLAIIFDKLHGLQSVDMPEEVLEMVERATDYVQKAMYRATDYDHGWNQTQNAPHHPSGCSGAEPR